MNPFGFPLLADENVHPDVVVALQALGVDIVTVSGVGLVGRDDAEVLRYAYAERRVVMTHDADFGMLAILKGEPIVGVVHLRPGHIRARFVLELIDAIRTTVAHVEPPFIVVAERRGDTVRVRVRTHFGT